MSTQPSETKRAPRPGNPLAPYMALAGLWLLTLTIIPPDGNFPLNDDWIYAKIVQHLADTGKYQHSPYADPTFILQAYWGAAFVKIFGFSFETLRTSTLVLALVALWAAHWAAREAGLNARWAFLVALTLMVNPLFLNLSYTFMTDVPFLALGALSGAAYLRAFRTQQARWVAVATGIAGCTYFVRQFAVVLPIAALIVMLHPLKLPLRSRLNNLGTFIGVVLLVGLLRAVLPRTGLGLSGGWNWDVLGNTWMDRVVEILRQLSYAFSYLSVYMLPVAAAWIAAKVTQWRKNETPESRRLDFRAAAIVGLLALLVAWLITKDWPYRLPGLGNLLIDLGVGPLLMPGMLDGSMIMAGMRLGAWPWRIITVFAILGAAGLIALHGRISFRAITRSALQEPTRRTELFLALWSIGMLLILAMPPVAAHFDRYFLTAQIPASIVAVGWLASRSASPSRVVYVVAAAVHLFGLVCLQDYVAWNAARWKAAAVLQQEHKVPVEQINGGYEYNGWIHSDRFAEESRRSGKKEFGPLGWWTIEDTYRVSLRQPKRFEVIGKVPYFSWLGFQQREILMLHRTEPDPKL